MRIKNIGFIATGLAILVIAVFLILQTDKQAPTKISYYHWRNSYNIDDTLLDQTKPYQLYVKFLDIGYSNKLEVISTRFIKPPRSNTVPVVYIDNRVLKNEGVDPLLTLIKKKINPRQYSSLQIDCDWTLNTRKKYFTLLRDLGKSYPNLSATIRLHQIKYFQKTGVPPVKTGVLMYYNMSDIQDTNTKNYILDLDIAKRYHVNFDHYPLPLDLALPLYHQIRVIRQNKVVTILTGKQLNHTYLEKISANKYKVKQAHYVQSNYLYKDDLLIVDQVSEKDLQTAAHTLKALIKPHEIIFYEINNAKDFGYEYVENIRRIFD